MSTTNSANRTVRRMVETRQLPRTAVTSPAAMRLIVFVPVTLGITLLVCLSSVGVPFRSWPIALTATALIAALLSIQYVVLGALNRQRGLLNAQLSSLGIELGWFGARFIDGVRVLPAELSHA